MDNQLIIQSSQPPSQTACKDLRSEITYELVSGSDSEMSIVPTLLGRGRFAKVYKAWQRSAGHNVRPVAIKILHENIEQRSEQLFLQEISLLKKLTSAAGVNVISVLDILQLGPMVMCGNCGQIYHPRCPRCGEHLLERYDPKHEAYAALRGWEEQGLLVHHETVFDGLESCVEALMGCSPARTSARCW